MASTDKHLMDWLRDAHAMEMQALQMMETQVRRIENYPEMTEKLRSHIAETRGQAERLAQCIKRRGGDTSALKDAAGRLTAMAQGLSGVFVGDEIVKGAMANYTFEHFEISSYRALIAAAEQAGDAETRSACETNLREEEAMAAWLADALPGVTQRYLQRDLAGTEAKH